MRRIPRPQRSIAQSTPSTCLLAPRTYSSPCRSALQPRASFAPFSTTSTPRFLLSDKQDKKKHQAFVRRWQKRLLGDSEPIGAHVDPYDKTSPVRISPEEYGEEEEVLVDEDGNEISKDQSLEILYKQANTGKGLRVIGGRDMMHKLEEEKMAAEFEILTMKTYTPLSLRMADEIEDLTGTPYTLRGDNLMMAQMFQEVTGKPYTEFSFGRVAPIKALPQLRRNFQRAIVEVFTLRQEGLDLDLTSLPNRGIYNPPHWISQVKTQTSPTGELVLIFPEGRTPEKLLQKMQDVPEWDSTKFWQESQEESLTDAAEDLEFEQLEEPAAQIGTSTEPRRFALAKVDESKRFDFMSNRPVPRTKPQEAAPKVEEAPVEKTPSHSPDSIEASALASEEAFAALRHNVLVNSAKMVERNVSTLRHTVFQTAASVAEMRVAAIRDAIRNNITTLASEESTTIVPEAKWRHASLADPTIKFALTKRLIQLTGIRISDPHLNAVQTLGDLYGQLCSASKPKPKKLFDQIRVETEKKKATVTDSQTQLDLTKASKKKPAMDALLTLPNVHILPKRLKSYHKHRSIGLAKVIDFALAERDLESETRIRWPYKNAHAPKGASKVLAFGEIIPPSVVSEMEREREVKEKERQARRDAYLAQNA